MRQGAVRQRPGQQLKDLTVTDEWTKEGLAIEVDGRLRSGRVIEVLSWRIRERETVSRKWSQVPSRNFRIEGIKGPTEKSIHFRRSAARFARAAPHARMLSRCTHPVHRQG